MILVLQISGSKSDLIKAHPELKEKELVFEKISEKQISEYSKIRNLINIIKPDKILFSTIDLNFLRFSFFINLHFLLNSITGGIIDDSGNKTEYNIFKFICLEFPLFIIELLLSCFVVIYYHLKIPIMRWFYKTRF